MSKSHDWILLKGVCNPKLLKLLKKILIKLAFLLLHTARFDERWIFSLFVFVARGFFISVFFYTSNSLVALFYI